ncbi:DUF5666 domain-containing protein [Leifsonia sp. NPDC077715]|uniref:DUF5666 domain-containing protein n=1 Tax=Leifsonia sp. NPDC077715 TaxID=3155539 RepID=UPI003416C251
MSNTEPTEPIPPRQEPPVPPAPPAPAAGPAPVPEPFYKRHGLAFAISTLVLSIVVLIGIFTAGAFAVAGVVTRVGERMISHSVPHEVQPGVPGMPGMPGQPGEGGGKADGNGKGNGGGLQQGQALVRGTIASISGDTWTIDRQNGASVDVKVNASTVYGTPGQSSSKSDFSTGDEVVVIGSRSDGTLTAKRILKLDSFPTRPPSTPGPATPGS